MYALSVCSKGSEHLAAAVGTPHLAVLLLHTLITTRLLLRGSSNVGYPCPVPAGNTWQVGAFLKHLFCRSAERYCTCATRDWKAGTDTELPALTRASGRSWAR